MTSLNPFKLLIVVTALILMVAGAIAIIAPSLSVTQTWIDGSTHQYLNGVEIPQTPVFPTLPDLSVQGNFNSTFAFSQTAEVSINEPHSWYESPTVLFDDFSPDKRVQILGSNYALAFNVQRYGTVAIIPWWYDEPIFYMNGERVSNMDFLSDGTLSPQTISDNFNGTYSTFIIDLGSTNYEAFISFSPLSPYTDMVSSWNNGGGYNVWIYGNGYELADWGTQIVSYLGWLGSVIGYFVYFIAYIIAMSALMFSVIGIAGAWASGLIVLVLLAFIGGLFMYFRGTSDK